MPPFRSSRPAPPMPQSSSRLTFRRLRHPTPLPTSNGASDLLGRYLSRLTWLFG